MNRLAPLVVIAFLVVAFALVPAVTADPIEPLAERVQEKADDAQNDPERFVEDHATKEGIDNETRWTKHYACFAAREAAKEAGQQPPDLEVCPEYEDAREDDEQRDEDDQAVAEPLDPIQGEADRLLDDTAETVDRIVDDPKNVWQEFKGYLERTIQAAERIIRDLVGFVRDVVGVSTSGTLQGIGWLWEGLSWAAKLPQVTGSWMVDTTIAGAQATYSGLASAVGAVASGVTWAVEGIAGLAVDAAQGSLDAVKMAGEGAVSWTQSVRDAVGSLFERETGPDDLKEPVKDLDRVTGPSDDLLDSVDRLVPLD